MQFVQLTQRLRQEAGASGTGPLSCQNQTGESLRFVNWINDAWLDIQSLHRDWDWMRTSVTFPTVSQQGKYSLSQIGISANFGYWERESFRNYANPSVTLSIASPCVVMLQDHGLSVGDTVEFSTTGALPTGVTAETTYYVASIVDADDFTFAATVGGAAINTSGTQSGTQTMTSGNTTIFAGMKSEIYMDPLDFDEWRDSYLYGALRFIQTRPMQLAVAPDKSICLGPIPASGYTIVGDYFTVPAYMVNDTDVPLLPAQFHMAIVWRALMYYGQYEESAAVVQRSQTNYSALIRRIENDRLPEVLMCGALA